MSKKNTGKENFALGKENYILLVIGFAIIVLGFILMIGGKSEDPTVFNEEEIIQFSPDYTGTHGRTGRIHF